MVDNEADRKSGETMDAHTANARAEYAAIRSRSHAETPAAFDAAARKYLADHGTDPASAGPAEWVHAAKFAIIPCRRCSATGRFITYVENGIPRGPGGVCFRCNGKGYQTDEDARRNFGADVHYINQACT